MSDGRLGVSAGKTSVYVNHLIKDHSGPDTITCPLDPYMSDLTRLLGNASAGDTQSLNQLYEQVYAELRSMAGQKMPAERAGHTLQPTALVHEAYLRLGGGERFKFESRAHF